METYIVKKYVTKTLLGLWKVTRSDRAGAIYFCTEQEAWQHLNKQ